VPSFFSNKRLIILLAAVIAMVAVVGVTMKERAYPTWAEQFIRDTTGFFQSLAYKPARGVAGFFESIGEIQQLYSENQKLKASLQEHAILVAKIYDLEQENKNLKNLLDIKSEISEYQVRAAEVIMRSPDRWHHQLTINRGQKHGIKPNLAVITDKGLVGRVKSVSQFSSVVELLSDVNRSTQVSAVVQGNEKVYGVIEQYQLDQGALFFKKIPMDAPLEIGQKVITSGLGGVFPKGLYIGEIFEVTTDEYGLTQTALVKPAADLYQIDYVYIVERAFNPKQDEPVQEEDEGEEEVKNQ